jgi:hypothetical protein
LKHYNRNEIKEVEYKNKIEERNNDGDGQEA